jgi:signal transduction histidine kinase
LKLVRQDRTAKGTGGPHRRPREDVKLTAAGIRPWVVAGAAVATGLLVRLVWTPAFQSTLVRALVETFVMIAAVAAAASLATSPGPATLRRIAYVYALCTLAWLSFWWAVVPVLDGVGNPRALSGWSLVLTRLGLATMFAGAALQPDVRPASPRRAAVLGGLWVGAALVASAVAGHFLPMAPDSPRADWGASLHQGTAPFVVRLATVALWTTAVVGFARRAQAHRRREDVVGVAVAALFTAGTAYSAVLPTLPSAYITPVAGARLLVAVLLLAYAVDALRLRYAEARAVERVELAALLHDGVVQELALITMLREAPLPNRAELSDAAAQRAADELRTTIQALRLAEGDPRIRERGPS